MEQKTSKAPVTHHEAAAKDNHGNPKGTTYTQEGLPIGTDGKPVENGIALPQDTEKPVMYEEDGIVFTLPADAPTKISAFRADLAQLQIAIDGGKRKIETAQVMMDEADEADKPIFAKSIASQQAAVESNSKKHAEVSDAKKEFELSLITPAQRKDERMLIDVNQQIAALMVRKTDIENRRKQYGIGKNEVLDEKNKAKATAAAAPSTAEQELNMKTMLDTHKTQGAAIVALVKEGKTNAEIANYLGINPANVPGPKNKWLRGEGAADWYLDVSTGRVAKKA